MVKRIKREWMALSLGERRRIIVTGVEMLIEGSIFFGGFVSFLILAAALADKFTC